MPDAHAGGAPPSPDPSTSSPEDDGRLIEALRARDEATFATLVDRYGGSLLRLAMVYVRDRSAAEEVVQDTWIGLLESLDRFEGRSSLKTWLFRILINCARARARKDARSIPFSAAFRPEEREPDQFGFARFAPGWVPGGLGGHWIRPPARWEDEPERRVLASETRASIQRAIDGLPAAQREVITLRDVAGFDAGEVCNLLELSDTNQRVILHRARTRVRRALEQHFAEAGA
jgi:RNA polymerase sigma-70 factor (ECF subfamily)